MKAIDGRYPIPRLIITGLAAGLLSGLFGIGGGTVIVPLLTLWIGMDHKVAAGTSITAMLPTALVGVTSYALRGNINWLVALALALGITVGAQLGSRLLDRLPLNVVKGAFVAFLLAVVVTLWFVIPVRDSHFHMTWLSFLLLILTGLLTGVIAGPIGVGGGAIVVPAMMFFFGIGDLVARGSSLLMMIPGSISGTVANTKRGNVNVRAGLIVGLAASVCVPFSSYLAGVFTPFQGNVLFSAYLLFVAGQMIWRAYKESKAKGR
ncbi:sulfite exporter TauE/SafE family protein [Actinobaculum sp. 352]|uniref:sulfite exporter TauE/SafE family protein n=1 Tax=Actinobaculum sp. 352 TaxID=2490946 RepID=UPI000F7D8A84|nr:sulfite exporter TauE/SafE family protein [Actinobaculum sp. 352]RTE49532.1 sulfite exporter TauE/SafE family protein [Actinobaculum sp. 352]